MAVSLDQTRKFAVIAWENDKVGEVTVRARNPENDDVSITHNSYGEKGAVLAFGLDYHGSCHVAVSDESDNDPEEGDIEV
jgi:hypothetical protein